jgi:quercetin dioxygenase-like cupin family protein
MKWIWYALAVTLLVGTGAAPADQQSSTQDPVMLSPQYYTVKADDERVRVLEYRLKPGQKEAMHSHPADVVYFFAPANLRVTLGDGSTTDSSVTEGEVLVRDPLTHAVENIGNTELHALLVELKNR